MDTIEAARPWQSADERVPTVDELHREDVWRDRDARIGAEARRRFGSGNSLTGSGRPHRPPAIIRYPRGVYWILRATPQGQLIRRVAGKARREVLRIARKLVPESASTVSAGVLPAPATSEEGNAALNDATSDFVVFLRDGAELAPHALERISDAFAAEPGVHVVYGGFRTLAGGVATAPAFSPLRLRTDDYLGLVVAVAVRPAVATGGFREGTGSASLLDLVLRTPTESVAAIPQVLGVGDPRDGGPDGADDAAAVVRRIVADRGEEAVVTAVDRRHRRIDYAVRGEPMVSIIIPTRGSSGSVAGRDRVFVTEAVRSVVEQSTWPSYEIVVVADDPTPQAVIDELRLIAGERLVLVRWSEEFDFSAKMNRGAVLARGKYLILLNDDVDLVTPDWIERLLALGQRDEVVAASGLLYFEDGAIQHLGHVYRNGAAGHVAFGMKPGAAYPMRGAEVTREVSGVTAALMLVSSQNFSDVGGLSPLFPGNYNDVDLGMKLRLRGGSMIVDGRTVLYHFESRTRDPKVRPSELVEIHRRWGALMQEEPFDR